jgi:Kef-type K+ transport system membrane component KefB
MFTDLTILVAAGLAGPLLASGRVPLIPMVVGELAVGALLGHTGFDALDPTKQPYPFLHDVGFALLMFTAGTRLDPRPLRQPGQLMRVVGAATVATAVAIPAAFAANAILDIGRPVLLVVLLLGSSAAVLFPMLEERRLEGPSVSFVMAWVAVADSVTLIVMPLTLARSSDVAPALLGDLAIVALGALVFAGAKLLQRTSASQTLRRRSRQRGWALQLRFAILLLFGLAAIAEKTQGSSLVAGFAAGVVLAQLHESKRLARQISGLADGFFVPAFFVLLGATLDLRGLASDPVAIWFGLVLAVCAIAVHLAGALAAAPSCRVASGLAASAQLGLPAAAAALGLSSGMLSQAAATALVGAATLTLVPASFGVAILVRKAANGEVTAGPEAQAKRIPLP